jgi:hypothetical protein
LERIKIGFPIIGLLLISISIWLFSDSYSFTQNAEWVVGKVIDFQEKRSDQNYTYAPIVSFETTNNDVIKFISSTSSNPPSYKVGEIVNVLYIPSNPHKAKIDSFFSLWGISLIFFSLGFVFFTVGLTVIFFSRKKSMKAVL